MNLPADVFVDGKKYPVALHDLSRTGMFLRATDDVIAQIPAGSVVHVALAADGRRVVASAKVTHALTAADARALGRYAGVGVELCAPSRAADLQFAETIAKLVESCARRVPMIDRRIVVADPQTRLLERLSAALGEAGFAVATATNGMEALSACMRKAPDVVLLARDMPVVDGFRALAEIQRHPRLAGVPVMITSDNPDDLVQAFELGAMDFVARPFSTLEVVLRARRLAHVVASPVLDLDAAEILSATPPTASGPIRAPSQSQLGREVNHALPAAALAPTGPVHLGMRPSSPAIALPGLPPEPTFARGTIPPPFVAAAAPGQIALEQLVAAVEQVSDDIARETSARVIEAPEDSMRFRAQTAPVRLGSEPNVDEDAWQPGRERVMLRGDLAELPLPSLLGLLEHERKSGRLQLVHDRDTASIEVVDGRLVLASAATIPGDTRAVVMTLLDWTTGEFTLYASTPAPELRARDGFGLTHLLLEHARLADEAAASSRGVN